MRSARDAVSREIITSMHNRRGPAIEIAKAAFNCYEPLLQLGQMDDSLALLKKCRHEFQRANDVKSLGMAMTALADVEDKRGHGDAAIALVRDGLRYIHMAGDVVLPVPRTPTLRYPARRSSSKTSAKPSRRKT